MATIFGTATSGLLAYQTQLRTAEHNIANVNTPGYTRQRVDLSAQTPTLTGSGFVGTGVSVDTIRRTYDQFLTERVRDTASSVERYDIYERFAGRISDVLGDPVAGLNGGLEGFFQAVQTLADNPASVPERQLLLTEADSLVARFGYLDDQLNSMRRELNGQLDSMLGEINSLSQSIADINQDIVVATGRSGGNPPNDLLDSRDRLIEELSKFVSVKTVSQDDGSLNVFIGTGQSLVTGSSAGTLSLGGSAYSADYKVIRYSVGNSSTDITSNISGGQLGGLLAFRDEILDPSQNAIGRIGVVLASEFNAQHALGMDLDGNLGGSFFASGSPAWSANNDNSGSGSLSVSYDTSNLDDLTIKDYILSYDGSSWSLKDSDGDSVTMTGSGTSASPFNADGLNIVVSGTASSGDSFQIRPTRNGADGIGLLISDVRRIAAAAPVRIGETTNSNGVPTNSGTGSFSLDSVGSSFSALSASITFTYDATADEFSYTDGSSISGTLSYDPSSNAGDSYTVAGITFTINGTPANSDSFVISANSKGVGDNHNMLALAALQTDLTMENGTTNLQGAYGQLISDTATRTRQAEINRDAQFQLNQNAREQRDSVQGVNLDEEAANLLRFQQAYQAMARVITVADSMFQTLLSATQR
ncbi:flagellar hook-associated protein FlgK [Thiohalobacter sp. IOR34]|uniref:flagellar hook-associated protein FlgK n=1 Tax=Thiohalobacter sp. IOR34 TaxID=3057176 RepID=UPI0025B06CB5|nr:flagellar hook-associated protein FlgK [Thiohalobacter sp. IOR34]WJW74606.1 flagellar hook-associated protein FlgK [Thiohalobacter sp. IOR34]